MSEYPVSPACPKCGRSEYRTRRPEAAIAFRDDRVCKACNTRYTPPTPGWAAGVFILIGVPLVGIGGLVFLSVALGGESANPVGLLLPGFFGLLGLGSIAHGVRSLLAPGGSGAGGRPLTRNEYIAAWRAAAGGPDESWVLFEHGTRVVLPDPTGDLAGRAVEVLREWGAVLPGTSAGDFIALELDGGRGWLVTSHHDDISTFVGPAEVSATADDGDVGRYGRAKRGRDAEGLRVIHVEGRRA